MHNNNTQLVTIYLIIESKESQVVHYVLFQASCDVVVCCFCLLLLWVCSTSVELSQPLDYLELLKRYCDGRGVD